MIINDLRHNQRDVNALLLIVRVIFNICKRLDFGGFTCDMTRECRPMTRLRSECVGLKIWAFIRATSIFATKWKIKSKAM